MSKQPILIPRGQSCTHRWRSKAILSPSTLLQVPCCSFQCWIRKLHHSILNGENSCTFLESSSQPSLILSWRIHSDQNSHDVFSPPTSTMIPVTHLLHSTTQEKQPPYAIESIVSSSVSCFARGHESLLWTGVGSQSPRICFIFCVHLQPSYVTVSFSQCYRQSLSVLKISLTATCREQSQGKEKKHTKAKGNLERNWSQRNSWLGFFYYLKGHIFCGACRVCFYWFYFCWYFVRCHCLLKIISQEIPGFSWQQILAK